MRKFTLSLKSLNTLKILKYECIVMKINGNSNRARIMDSITYFKTITGTESGEYVLRIRINATKKWPPNLLYRSKSTPGQNLF